MFRLSDSVSVPWSRMSNHCRKHSRVVTAQMKQEFGRKRRRRRILNHSQHFASWICGITGSESQTKHRVIRRNAWSGDLHYRIDLAWRERTRPRGTYRCRILHDMQNKVEIFASRKDWLTPPWVTDLWLMSWNGPPWRYVSSTVSNHSELIQHRTRFVGPIGG